VTGEFEVGFDGLLPATPAQAWDAITVNAAGWSWPIEYEPWIGGAEKGLTFHGGTVTAWEPGRHFATRCEADDGWFNNLDYELTERDGGTFLRFRHNGVFLTDWDNNFDACRQHTADYYHSLGEYLAHFAGRRADYVTVDAPKKSATPGSFARLKAALGIPEDVAAGDRVELVAGIRGVADHVTPNFLGVRTADALHRVYGRDAFGWPVGVSGHLFVGDADALGQSWQAMLTETFE
jgi:hypothetical protein